jgi:hypothetical protein
MRKNTLPYKLIFYLILFMLKKSRRIYTLLATHRTRAIDFLLQPYLTTEIHARLVGELEHVCLLPAHQCRLVDNRVEKVAVF